MQMLDVLKRLAELDAKNPNIVKENQLPPAAGQPLRPQKIHKPDTEIETETGTIVFVRDSAGNPKITKVFIGSTDVTLTVSPAEIQELEDNIQPNETSPLKDVYRIVEVDIEDIQWSGSYAPATWGYHGGSPEEHPELDDYTIFAVGNGKYVELKPADLDNKAHDSITDWIHANASDSRDDDYYQEHKEQTMENLNSLRQLAGMKSSVAECGPMGMSGMSEPKTPATINITADSGEELGSMLAAIMQLAGVQKVEPEQLGVEQEPSTLTAEPTMGGDQSSSDNMRSVIDKMHDTDGEEETDEGEYDNSPADPTKPPTFDANEFSQNTNDGDGDSINGKRRTGMQPAATFESLMKDYRSFIGESSEEDDEEAEVEEGVLDKIKSGAKTAAKAVGKAITGPGDEELIQRLEKQTGGKRPAHISTPVKTNESTTLDILKLSGLRK